MHERLSESNLKALKSGAAQSRDDNCRHTQTGVAYPNSFVTPTEVGGQNNIRHIDVMILWGCEGIGIEYPQTHSEVTKPFNQFTNFERENVLSSFFRRSGLRSLFLRRVGGVLAPTFSSIAKILARGRSSALAKR